MFRTNNKIRNKEALKAATVQAEKNYVIQKNDFLTIQVYTNKGEVIIDPNYEILRERGSTTANLALGNEKPKFLVQSDGYIRFPMIDPIKLDGYTLAQTDSILRRQYEKYYKDVFVITQYLNKRVFVLGGSSAFGGGKVIPLQNENMHLIEVLAMVGGIGNDARASNIRLIRGDLKDPQVFVIDLRTIEGLKNANLIIEPGDIIYIEPIRRVALETLRDILPFLSFITTVLTLILFIRSSVK
jgi:polysaccharide export outer membrane protein